MLHKIKFNNDDIFEFIPCSLINIDTSEVYINEYAEKNLMNLSYLKSNDKLNIKFNLKNDKWNLIAEKIDSNIIFKISFLPQSNNIPERKLNIFLEHKKFNIELSNVDSNLSLNDI
nr:hypothetical protein [uncultured Clostridium sp.]